MTLSLAAALRAAPLVLALAACTGQAPPTASLPFDSVDGAGDPARAAIINSAYAFADPAYLAGKPDLAARATAQLEYLAAEIPVGPRWVEWTPQVGMGLQGARTELRGVLGIPDSAQPQAVVDALYAASRALRRGDRPAAAAALRRAEAAEGEALLIRLAALPPLPRTRLATALAHQELIRVDQESRMGGVGSSDGGKD
jgi:hypothetical protein